VFYPYFVIFSWFITNDKFFCFLHRKIMRFEKKKIVFSRIKLSNSVTCSLSHSFYEDDNHTNFKTLKIIVPERFSLPSRVPSIKLHYSSEIKFKIPNQQVISPIGDSVFCPGYRGMKTWSSVLDNISLGISKPYFLRFYVRGIGFKVWPIFRYQGIRSRLGFNHKSLYLFSTGLVGRGRKYKFVLSAIDSAQLKQSAADVVRLRIPDAYRVKGVRYLGDNLFPKPRRDKKNKK